MGAWHVNAVDELHLVQSGEGIMEFVTLDGIVSVVIGAGDVIEVRGAEQDLLGLAAQGIGHQQDRRQHRDHETVDGDDRQVLGEVSRRIDRHQDLRKIGSR